MKFKTLNGLAYLVVASLVGSSTLPMGALPIDVLKDSNQTDGRLVLTAISDVYNHAVSIDDGIDGAVTEIQNIADDESHPNLLRVKSFLSVAHLYWRHGYFDKAIEAVDAAVSLEETTDGTLLKARILDARGHEVEALEWYNKALASTESAEEREFIQIRLAMIDVDETNVDALLDLAQQRDQEFQNRAAIALAILGHEDRALELYTPNAEESKYFRQLIRLTEWAIMAEEFDKAAKHSWLAYDAAEYRFDRLYALSLLDESYRKRNELDTLIAALEQRGSLDEDLRDLHIDLLTDLERYDEAIELYHSLEIDPEDIEARFRLLQIYDVANRTDEMVEEYQRLIEEEPNVVQWYTGLASYFVGVAQPERAEIVWNTFETSNAQDVGILAQGGAIMSQMGFEPLSLAMIHRHADTYGATTTGQIYLFETHFSKGRFDEATTALDELIQVLPKTSGDLRLVADAFERLQQFDRALEVFLDVEEYGGEPLGYDDRMRLAWLHSVMGNKEESLGLWQELWIQEEAPARRSFAESQFLLIASELNKLADIAIDLEQRLFAGTADKNEVNLLVRIYTEVGDAFSAAEVVKEFSEYSDISEIEKLRQLALIYLQLEEYQKYDEVLQQLEKIDPENRIEHIQNIVLNMVAFNMAAASDDKLEQISHWLAQLREFDEEAVTGEFEASVLSMSGFTEQAIESYRRALIQHPTHSDNLLLMGELLKESDRVEEAVSLFQYVAEHSRSDNEFVVAIDGILNMIGQRRFGQRLPLDDQAIFRWTHRIILERITGRDDKFYLYTLLSEIANETNDNEAEFVAIENSISQAGIRRLSVLRELVTMATQDAGFFSLSQKTGDPERQITYGRRLIRLQQQLPPEVYVNIAKTLLEQDDTVAAEQSLNLVKDITGLLDINQTKADLFLEAGFAKQALGYYSHALSLDQDNNALLLKTASLRENTGNRDVANGLYLKGALNILQSQAVQLHADAPELSRGNTNQIRYLLAGSQRNTSVNRDYTTYFEHFAQGFISTWSNDDPEASTKLATVDEFFRAELENVISLRGNGDKLPLHRYTRLNHICHFIRRAMVGIDHAEYLHEMDLALAQEFLSDPPPEEAMVELLDMEELDETNEHYANFSAVNYIAKLIQSEYEDHGVQIDESVMALIPPSLVETQTAGTADTLLNKEMSSAIESSNVERVVRLSSVVEAEEPLDQVFQQFLNEGKYQAALGYAKRIFGRNEYLRMIPFVAAELTDNPRRHIELIVESPNFILSIEEDYGQFFETADQFIEFLSQVEVKEFTDANYLSSINIWGYLSELSDSDLMAQYFVYLTENLGSAEDPFSLNSRYMIDMHKSLMTHKFDEEQQSHIASANIVFLDSLDFGDEYLLTSLYPMLLNFHANPGNASLLMAVIDTVAERVQLDVDVKDVMTQYFEGDKLGAYRNLINSQIDPFHVFYIQRMITSTFPDEAVAFLEQIIAGECPTEIQANFLVSQGAYLPTVGIDTPMSVDPSAIMERFVDCFPEDQAHRMRLLMYSIGQGHRSTISERLTQEYERDNANESIRTALFLWNKKIENFDSALKVTLDGEPDLRNHRILDEILFRNDESPFNFTEHPDAILHMIRDVESVDDRLAIPGPTLPKSISRAARVISELNPEQHTTSDAAKALRFFWRRLSYLSLDQDSFYFYSGGPVRMFMDWPKDQEQADSITNRLFYRSSTTATLSLSKYIEESQSEEPTVDEKLIDSVIQDFPLGRDLEQLLTSQDPLERRRATDWYELIVQAYLYHPEDAQLRVAQLSERIVSGEAYDHEFGLWIPLSNALDQPISQELNAAFNDWFLATSRHSHLQLINAARFYARTDHQEAALDCYKLLLANLLRFHEFGRQALYVVVDRSPDPIVTVEDVFADLQERFSSEVSMQFVADVLPMVQTHHGFIELDFLAAGFALKSFQIVAEGSQVIEAASAVSPVLDEVVAIIDRDETLRPYETAPLIQLVRAHMLNGEWESALAYLRQIFVQSNIDSSTGEEYDPYDALTRLVSSRSYNVTSSVSQFMRLTGYTVEDSEADLISPIVPSSLALLSASLDEIIDYGREDWMNTLTDSLAIWVNDDTLDHHAVVTALGIIAYEYQKQGQLERFNNLAAKINEAVNLNLESWDRENLSVMATLAANTDFPLNVEIFGKLVEYELLNPDTIVATLDQLKQQSEPSSVIEVLAPMSLSDFSLSALRELLEVGKLARNSEFSNSVDELIKKQEDSLRELEINVL